MHTVYRFSLGELPGVALEKKIRGFQKIVHFDESRGELCFWAIVDPESKEETTMRLSVLPTGARFDPENTEYLRTFTSNGFVWHLVRGK